MIPLICPSREGEASEGRIKVGEAENWGNLLKALKRKDFPEILLQPFYSEIKFNWRIWNTSRPCRLNCLIVERSALLRNLRNQNFCNSKFRKQKLIKLFSHLRPKLEHLTQFFIMKAIYNFFVNCFYRVSALKQFFMTFQFPSSFWNWNCGKFNYGSFQLDRKNFSKTSKAYLGNLR